MASREVDVINKLGLHARAAAKLVKLASEFQSNIAVIRDGREVNGKSIMGVMMLAAAKGTRLEIKAEGPDENEALDKLEALFADRFGEGE